MRLINHCRTQHYADCVIGEWRLDDVHLVYTLEPPWRNNEHNVSCIPVGEYDLVKGTHTNEGEPSYPCYTVANVPNRTDIDVHIGNYPADTLGCILVGGTVKGHALEDGSSTPAFNTLMHVLDAIHEPLRLRIEDKFEVVGGPRLPDPVPIPDPIGEQETAVAHPTFVPWWQRAWAALDTNKRNLAIVLGTAGTALIGPYPLVGSIVLAISGILGWVGIGHDVKKEAAKEETNDWLAKLFNAIEAWIRSWLAKRGK
jgi:hypothetical protein